MSDTPSAAPGDWRAVRPMDLEPYYCHWVSKLTSDDLHDKGDIATVLALLHRELDDVKDDYLRVHKEKCDLLFARPEVDASLAKDAERYRMERQRYYHIRRTADLKLGNALIPEDVFYANYDKIADKLNVGTTLPSPLAPQFRETGAVLDAKDAGWNEAIKAAREACLEVGRGTQEASKAKDATDYVAGYQDAAVDCDEALLRLTRLNLMNYQP